MAPQPHPSYPLPIFLKLSGQRILLVGAGAVALSKLDSLLPLDAQIQVVAPEALPPFHDLARQGRILLHLRPFAPADLDGAVLAIAATNVPQVNADVHAAARERGLLANSVDDIPNCDFFFGSVVQRGALQIAISTNGQSPAIAQQLRQQIDALLPAQVGEGLEQLGALRRQVLALHPPGEARKQLLHHLARQPICSSPACPARLAAISGSANPSLPPGKVYLVGAGPGDPELLTLKALRILQQAQVILHDDLVTPAILALASPQATVINVGKRCGEKLVTQEGIHQLMIEHAQAGRAVVRLKSGDPLVFGRASEEILALLEAGLEHEVVPGVTAASAAAAAAGCSLTDRHCASGVTFATAHRAQEFSRHKPPLDSAPTRVVYMPGRDLAELAQAWLDEGLSPDLPCAVVAHASRPTQQVLHTTLRQLAETPVALAPSVVLAGWAIRDLAAEPAITAQLNSANL